MEWRNKANRIGNCCSLPTRTAGAGVVPSQHRPMGQRGGGGVARVAAPGRVPRRLHQPRHPRSRTAHARTARPQRARHSQGLVSTESREPSPVVSGFYRF